MTAVNQLYVTTEHNANVKISYRRDVYIRQVTNMGMSYEVFAATVFC